MADETHEVAGEAALGGLFDSLHATLAAVGPPERQTNLISGRAGQMDWPGVDGWADALLALPPELLDHCERVGLRAAAAVETASLPDGLVTLCETVAATSAQLGRTADDCSSSHGGGGDAGGGSGGGGHNMWRQSSEKTEQVRALLSAAQSRLNLRRVRRVVDIGCGKGHVTAALHQASRHPSLRTVSAQRRLSPLLAPPRRSKCQRWGWISIPWCWQQRAIRTPPSDSSSATR